jgi:hypothetical protein
MVVIQLPALGTSKEQLAYVVGIVKKYVPDTFQRGVQIILGKDVIDNSELQEQVYQNITETIPEDFVIIFHAPISPHEDDSRLNLLNEECVAVYNEIAKLAQRCNAHSMIIHSNCVFMPDKWTDEMKSYEYVQSLFPKVLENMQKIIDQSTIPVMIENLPLPLRGDVEADPTKLPFDPFLGTIGQMEEFLQKSNAPFCFDTSHFGILRKKIHSLIRENITIKDIEQEGLRWVYPEHVVEQPSLVGFWDKVEEKTLCIQLADFQGMWDIEGGKFDEGYPIGDGELKDEFAELLQKAVSDNPDLILSVDVEVENFLDRPEQIEGIKRVIGYLDSTNFK